MAVQLIKKSENAAKARISAGDINDTAAWVFSAADGNALLGEDADNWSEYEKWHLGKDTEAKAKTKARFKYPYGKNGKVYTSALRAIRSRAAQQDHTSVFDAAGRLLDQANEKLGKETETKGDTTMKEIRAYQVPEQYQVRAVEGSDGIFEGYAIVWDVIDSYGTRFKKGCCSKTLDERGDKIKILNQHNTNEPIGKPLAMAEDDIGLHVRGQLVAGVQKADEMRALMDAQVIDGLSIGFSTLQEKPGKLARDITEIKLYEFSPVTFPSNEEAAITGFRAEITVEPDNAADVPSEVRAAFVKYLREGDEALTDEERSLLEPHPGVDGTYHVVGVEPEEARAADDEITVPRLEPASSDAPNITDGDDPDDKRATDFAESLNIEQLYEQGWLLKDALFITLSDIWWSDAENEEILGMFDTALADFSKAYLDWAAEFIGTFWEQRHSVMDSEDLAGVFKAELRKSGDTIETLAAKTSFTADELTALSRGQMLSLESRAKLAELPESIRTAHQDRRKAVVESLCDELRAAQFGSAESARFKSLLGLNDSKAGSETRKTVDAVSGMLKTIRESAQDSGE